MTIIQALLSPFVPFTPSTRSVVDASGGNQILIFGSYKVHIFTGPGTFTVTSAPPTTQISFWVIGGGGGGGAGGEYPSQGFCGAGGGAGGFRAGTLPLVTPTTPAAGPGPWVIPITVGAGGAGGVDNVPSNPSSLSVTGFGFPGTPSIFNIRYVPLGTNIESNGGGGGASQYTPGPGLYSGRDGGSGGGSTSPFGGPSYSIPGGIGNSPPVPTSPVNLGGPQGNPGAPFPSGLSGSSPTRAWGSGGGGAGSLGGKPPTLYAGDGTFEAGTGKDVPVLPNNYDVYGTVGSSTPLSPATTRAFAGGGEGGTRPPLNPTVVPEPSPSPGYTLGGGGRKNPANSPASPALTNTGSGGAGASGTTSGVAGGAGAPGIVIVAYLY